MDITQFLLGSASSGPEGAPDTCHSLEQITEALLPPEWVKDSPNEAALSFDYRLIRERADPILRKRFRHSDLKRLELSEKFPDADPRLLDRLADCSPQRFALSLLSKRYRRGGAYLWNLIKRGNLCIDIALHWRKALLSSSPPSSSPDSQTELSPDADN